MKKLFTRLFRRSLPVSLPSEWIQPEQTPKSLALLIGDTIVGIKHYYEARSLNGWLDCSTTYITLQRNGTVSFPISGDDTFINVTADPRAEDILRKFRQQVLGRKITDIYYYYDEEGNPDDSRLSFFELDNGCYITENRMAPYGTGHANLFTYSSAEFAEVVKREDGAILSWTASAV